MSAFIEKLRAHPDLWAEHVDASRKNADDRLKIALHELKTAMRLYEEVDLKKEARACYVALARLSRKT